MKKKKLVSMLTYGAADMLGGGVGQVLSLYYLTFLTFVMGLPPALAGLAIAIAKIWDGISDPMMGIIVDRTKTRWGACRPYFLIAALPVFVTYFMLWYGWGINSTWGKFAYFTTAYVLFNTAYTIAMVPYEALLPRMIDSYKERTDFSSLRMVFSGIACVATTYIYEAIIPITQDKPLSAAFQPNFVILGLVLAAFFALPLLVTFFGTKENPRLALNEKMTLRQVFRNYKEVLSNSTYRKYYILNLSGAFVSSAILSSLVIFIYLMFGNIESFFLGFTLVFVVVNLKGAIEIGFFPINVILMKKYNKHRPYLVDLPLIAVGAFILLFVTPSTPVWLMLIAISLIGAGVSCLGFVPMTLLPDLTDVDEMTFGKRREGMNSGLTTMGKKIVSGISLASFGFILQLFGLETDKASPAFATASSMAAVKIMLCGIPIVFCVAMIIISKSYALDEKAHNTIKALLNKKAQSGKLELTDEEIAICEKVSGKAASELWITK
jgi:oligogalacturonide transporter